MNLAEVILIQSFLTRTMHDAAWKCPALEGAALQAPGPQEPPGTVCHKGKLLGN